MNEETEILNFDSDRNCKVVLSNKLAEAESRLSTLEFKIIMMMASSIDYNDINLKPTRIKTEEYIKVSKLSGNSVYNHLREAALGLLSKKLTIREKDSILHTHWVTSVRTYKKKGYVDLCFHPELKPYLLQLRHEFTIVELGYILVELKSVYSARVYMLMKQYLKIGEREIEVEQLKKILGVIFIEEESDNKIEKDKYKNFSDFEKNVLLPAKVEISEKTDLKINYKITGKEKKKVVKLTFTIELKENISEKDNGQEVQKIEKENTEQNTTIKNSIKKAFIIPPDEGLKAFWEKNKHRSSWEEFRDYYNSNGWKVGKTAMKNWESAARNWERRDKEYHPDRHKIEIVSGIKIENKESKEISDIRSKIKFSLWQIDQTSLQYFNLSNIEKNDNGFKIKAIHPKAENFRQHLEEINVFLE